MSMTGVLGCVAVVVLLAGCTGSGHVDVASLQLEGSWLLVSSCEAALPPPAGCTAGTGQERATLDTTRQTVKFCGALWNGRYHLSSETTASGAVVEYIALPGGRAPAQMRLTGDTLALSWQYVDGPGYRFVRDR